MKLMSFAFAAAVCVASLAKAQFPVAYDTSAPFASEVSEATLVTTSVVFVDYIPAIFTSTVLSTSYATVYSCPLEVTDCPISSTSVSVQTSVVAVSTTICPVTLTSTGTSRFTTAGVLPPVSSSVAGAFGITSASGGPAGYTSTPLQTLTRTATSTVTISSSSSIESVLSSSGEASTAVSSVVSAQSGVTGASAALSVTSGSAAMSYADSTVTQAPVASFPPPSSVSGANNATEISASETAGASGPSPSGPQEYSSEATFTNSSILSPQGTFKTSSSAPIQTSASISGGPTVPFSYAPGTGVTGSSTSNPLAVSSSISSRSTGFSSPLPYSYSPGTASSGDITANPFNASSGSLPSPTSASNGTLVSSTPTPAPYIGAGIQSGGTGFTMHLCFIIAVLATILAL